MSSDNSTHSSLDQSVWPVSNRHKDGLSDLWVSLCASPARTELGHRWIPAALVWPLCGYRCFTLWLVKLSKREKWLPQFVREGGGAWGWGTGTALYVDALLTEISVLCLLNTSAFQPCARKGHIVFELNSSIIFWEMIYCRVCVFAWVCVRSQLAHSLSDGVYAIQTGRKVTGSQGLRVTGSALWKRGNRPNLRMAGSFLFWVEGTQRTLS